MLSGCPLTSGWMVWAMLERAATDIDNRGRTTGRTSNGPEIMVIPEVSS